MTDFLPGDHVKSAHRITHGVRLIEAGEHGWVIGTWRQGVGARLIAPVQYQVLFDDPDGGRERIEVVGPDDLEPAEESAE